MSVKVRFAPAPTGRLQVGNARIALANWLFARRHGGAFVLRFDDTDAGRAAPEHAAAIEADLAWLGLDWAETVRQSECLARYRAAAERLKAAGRLYPCYETEAELQAKRAAARARGEPPVYDRAGLALDAAARRRLEAEGRRPYWRFLLDRAAVAWEDGVRGATSVDAASLSDPVLLRADGRPLYALSSVVDDLELGITHVIRGEDHLTNTAVQVQVMAALDGRPPAFAHLPLLAGPGGERVSKRLGGLSLAALRERGIEPLALAGYLARLGTPDPIEPPASLDELAASFDLARLSRATAKFDPDELQRVNARLLHALPFEAVRERLAAMGLDEADEAFWTAVRGNLTRLDEAHDWHAVCRGRITPVIEDAGLTAQAAELLPPEPWDGGTWRRWTKDLEQATGRRGRALIKPLRLALTGRRQGPEMQALLPLIGRDRAARRLRGGAA